MDHNFARLFVSPREVLNAQIALRAFREFQADVVAANY